MTTCSGANMPDRNNLYLWGCRSDKQNIDERTMGGVIGGCITLYDNSNNNIRSEFVDKRFHVRCDVHKIMIVNKHVIQNNLLG